MRKVLLTALVATSFIFTGCFEDDDTPIIIEEVTNNITNNSSTGGGEEENYETIIKAGGIALDETWTSGNVYILDRKVVVQEGVTLTIEPGTIIKGRAGTGSLSSALIVARGAKINAKGTASNPIIFTAEADNIEPGQKYGTNLDETNNGLWGGVLILGKATSSFKNDVTQLQIEGISADDTFGLYGAVDGVFTDDDNSGVFEYISIRHGGTLIGEGNEINGLTLGAVGSGTTINNIEIVGTVDDGIEFFGGTVNVSNVLIWAQGDDGLDVDQAYSGTIDNAVVILGADSDHGLEIDGPEGTIEGRFSIKNLTLIGNTDTDNGEYADYRSSAMGSTTNVYAYGFKASSDVELDNDGVATNYNDGKLTFGTWEIVLPTGVTDVKSIFANKAETVTVTGFGDTASAVTSGNQTVGASTSSLSWTYANEAASLGF
ncbi:hypothetical protein MKD41_13195 [Lutibacter sp. A64]|uniref:hypothetical protein n=1 Tax=Lutibacter sp. A64 TaxID=2918526 RepID=UPI001F0593B2|nr:hypothetical protein [Lutibacter sp. A64]UMB53284.1 hypothetical protein MKD41_13195 [Lutibacter sp. A64]